MAGFATLFMGSFRIGTNVRRLYQRVSKQYKSQLVEEQFQHVLFIINGCPYGNEYQKVTVQFIGLLKDFLVSQRTKNNAQITSDNSERSSRDKELFLGLQTAIDLNPHKIIIGLDGNNSQTSAEQLSLIRDKLVGSLVNLTVTDLCNNGDIFDRDLAERIIKLNMNPFNKIIEAKSSSVQGHSRSAEYANERRQEAQRFLQFVRAVRAGKVSTKVGFEKEFS